MGTSPGQVAPPAAPWSFPALCSANSRQRWVKHHRELVTPQAQTGSPPPLCQPQGHVCRYTLVASICYDMFLQTLSFPRSAKNMSFSFCTTAPHWLGSLEGFHVCLCGLSRQKGWDFSRPGMFLFCSAVFCFFFFFAWSLQGEPLQLT